MIDIDRAEGFSPFRVWARGGQAPLRAQATLPPGPADLPRLTSGPGGVPPGQASLAAPAADHDGSEGSYTNNGGNHGESAAVASYLYGS